MAEKTRNSIIQAEKTNQNDTFHFVLKFGGFTVANKAKDIPPIQVR